jgi:hypothetical protein
VSMSSATEGFPRPRIMVFRERMLEIHSRLGSIRDGRRNRGYGLRACNKPPFDGKAGPVNTDASIGE